MGDDVYGYMPVSSPLITATFVRLVGGFIGPSAFIASVFRCMFACQRTHHLSASQVRDESSEERGFHDKRSSLNRVLRDARRIAVPEA